MALRPPEGRRPYNQPLWEDLVAYLNGRAPPERLEVLRELLQIDLRPKGPE